jgi:hypothetical protein
MMKRRGLQRCVLIPNEQYLKYANAYALGSAIIKLTGSDFVCLLPMSSRNVSQSVYSEILYV